ncbi:MAG: hypothetical protein MJH10_20760 [Epibacterium sp.]|nr:hypothetical protein [Epibacterium sp.]NQX75895.1 hypothetical protein [Epibacterium sp.]
MIDAMTLGMSALYAIGGVLYFIEKIKDVKDDSERVDSGIASRVEMFGVDPGVFWAIGLCNLAMSSLVFWPIWAIAYPIALAKRKSPPS